ncbi:MAG: NAD(+) diphosphatase [Bacteroidota bacterium]
MHPTESNFIPGHKQTFAAEVQEEGLVFLFHQQHIALVSEAPPLLPQPELLLHTSLEFHDLHYFGHWDGRACFTGHLPYGVEPLAELEWHRIRGLYSHQELFWIAGRGHHIAYWHSTHQFCGRCGTPSVVSETELARQCPNCGLGVYPRISPAVIMTVTRGNKILLGKISRPDLEMYSVLAGFVELGESLEACVAREVHEETGIAVKNIRYFNSQPWPFPDQLMVGFTAEYADGEIVLDDELDDAAWFTVAELNEINIPPKPSIARALIDQFVAQNS